MLKNYFLISLRNLKKHFGYSVINIVGLGLGLSTCLLLVIWISHELSYDKFHEKSDRIYRASLEYSFGGQTSKTSVSPTALLPALMTLPETEAGTRFYNPSAWSPFIVRYGDKFFQEEHFCTADSTFFDVFSFALLKGNRDKALKEPYSVIITQSTAKKYFGNEEPIGKTLRVNNQFDYTVTGIMEDVPSNSFLQFDFLASFHSLRAGREQPIWWSANYQTFVTLHTSANLSALEEKTNQIVKKAVANELSGESDYVRYNFMLLKDIHLKSDTAGEPGPVSDIKYVYIFSAIAALILLIACINYVNLATAKAADRAKEVGIRKVIGALRKQLFIQFIGESIIITFLAFVLAYFLAQASLPLFNELTDKTFSINTLLNPTFLGICFAALVLIALLAGAYPAFAITSFKPVNILKGNFKTSGKGIWLRKTLVILQFSISVFLIIGTLVVLKQLDFIQSKKLGFDRENTIILPLDNKTSEVFESLKAELVRSGAATYVGRGSESPTLVQGGYSINAEGNNTPGIIITGLIVDEEYIPALGMQLVAGRNFTKNDCERVKKDTIYSFILNESAIKELYLEKEEAIGKHVNSGGRKGEIIGVVNDFHFASLHKNIGPLMMFPEEWQLDKIVIKLTKGNVNETIEKVREVCATLTPHRPFEFEFLDEQYTALYKAEQRMGRIFIVFAVLAIVIACLGLLGLVSFSASQKNKEIGIRKVLGATASSIVVLITKDFTKLVLVAIVIALPLAYWLMEQWLSDFAYKTEIGIWPIAFAALLCVVIAFGTAAFQAIKAALVNPAETLRNE